MQQAKSGATRRFWIKDGLLITRGNCLYVLKVGNFRKEILRECHAAGHPQRTLAFIARGDYCPKMEEEETSFKSSGRKRECKTNTGRERRKYFRPGRALVCFFLG